MNHWVFRHRSDMTGPQRTATILLLVILLPAVGYIGYLIGHTLGFQIGSRD